MSRHHLLSIPSPVGQLAIVHDGSAVREIRIGFHPAAGTGSDSIVPDDPLGREIERQLREFFAGTRREFELPLAPEGTAFQWRVWEALAAIPVGSTRTYAEVARLVGRPGAARAVGQAVRRNRIPIVVPCHRVVASGGGLGGYLGATAGPGVDVKRWLLAHERREGSES